MPSPVPTPVAAALGLVPAVLDGVRCLPGKAIQLPILAVSSALTGLETARRGYVDLADRGERLIARLRGTSFDELEDRVEDSLQGTPFAKPYDVVEDALEDVTENVTAFVRTAPARARKAAGAAATSTAEGLDRAAETVEDLAERTGTAVDRAADTVEKAGEKVGETIEDAGDAAGEALTAAGDRVEELSGATAGTVASLAATTDAATTDAPTADSTTATGTQTPDSTTESGSDASADEVPEDEAPKGVPTPKEVQPDSTPVTTAASASVVETVERVSAKIGGEVVSHDELPLPDFDHLTLGAVRGRMRSLDIPQLVQLRDYEKAKANRLPIVTMLDNRIAKLASDPTAPLSGGDVSGPSAKASSPKSPARGRKKGGSKASPATTAPATSAPRTAFGGLGGDVPNKG